MNIEELPILHDNKFNALYFDEDNKTIFHIYKVATDTMTDEDFKKELTTLVKFCLDTRAESAIGDTRNLKFPITLELQKWTDENIFAKHKYLKKCAVLMSEDLVSQLSVEQVFDEEDEAINSISFETRFFSNMEEAIAWT